jgi:hypothetical protein
MRRSSSSRRVESIVTVLLLKPVRDEGDLLLAAHDAYGKLQEGHSTPLHMPQVQEP